MARVDHVVHPSAHAVANGEGVRVRIGGTLPGRDARCRIGGLGPPRSKQEQRRRVRIRVVRTERQRSGAPGQFCPERCEPGRAALPREHMRDCGLDFVR
jgi:hypothetical protein